jgi:hypothetical protein
LAIFTREIRLAPSWTTFWIGSSFTAPKKTMNRLFQASAFARPCTRILYEEQQINLFAECVKQ